MAERLKDAKVDPIELDEDPWQNIGKFAGASVVNGETVHEQAAF